MNATVAPHFAVANERNISSESSSEKQILIGYTFLVKKKKKKKKWLGYPVFVCLFVFKFNLAD